MAVNVRVEHEHLHADLRDEVEAHEQEVLRLLGDQLCSTVGRGRARVHVCGKPASNLRGSLVGLESEGWGPARPTERRAPEEDDDRVARPRDGCKDLELVKEVLHPLRLLERRALRHLPRRGRCEGGARAVRGRCVVLRAMLATREVASHLVVKREHHEDVEECSREEVAEHVARRALAVEARGHDAEGEAD